MKSAVPMFDDEDDEHEKRTDDYAEYDADQHSQSDASTHHTASHVCDNFVQY